MWLIIQIALGIALGYLIIVFWREILYYGVRGLIAVVVIALICGLFYFAYDNYDSYKRELGTILGYLSIFAICGGIVFYWINNE
jgi:hypothetical protein